jgi:hypothetical protein
VTFGFRPVRSRRLQALPQIIQTLPPRQLMFFWVAIFSTFAMLGFALDLLGLGRAPAPFLAMNVIGIGLLSVGYAAAAMPLRPVALALIMAVHAAYVALAGRAYVPLPEAPPGRLFLDFFGTTMTVLIGYSCFLRFINATAATFLRAQAEIALARDIHHVLVPAIDRTVGEYQFFGWSHASGAVGGDLVDVLESNGRWLGYIADVSGHGVGSGLIMGMFKSALRMRARNESSLGALLGDVQDVLMPLKPSNTFVTVACVRGGTDGHVDCAVAGHLPILRARNGSVEEVTEPQLAVGMFDEATFTSRCVECRPGDLFVLLTDGLIEVFDRERHELGFDWAKGVLRETSGKPLPAIADRLLTEARAFGAQLDDQTLLLIRRVGAGV